MLSLAAPTPDAWVDHAMGNLDEVLIDHAHCEKKAASTALALLFRYAGHTELLRPLSELAREELRHFEALLGLLEGRGLVFRRLTPGVYAKRLHQAVRAPEPDRLLDTLLVCGLIEARSCERMKLLAESLPDPQLADFYASLLASEARHFSTYLRLAEHRWSRAEVRARLDVLAAHEAGCLVGDPEPRLHSPWHAAG